MLEQNHLWTRNFDTCSSVNGKGKFSLQNPEDTIKKDLGKLCQTSLDAFVYQETRARYTIKISKKTNPAWHVYKRELNIQVLTPRESKSLPKPLTDLFESHGYQQAY